MWWWWLCGPLLFTISGSRRITGLVSNHYTIGTICYCTVYTNSHFWNGTSKRKYLVFSMSKILRIEWLRLLQEILNFLNSLIHFWNVQITHHQLVRCGDHIISPSLSADVVSLVIDWLGLPPAAATQRWVGQTNHTERGCCSTPPPLTHFVYSHTHHPLEGVTDSKELTHLLTLVNPISSWLICENYPSVIKIRYEGHSAQPQ